MADAPPSPRRGRGIAAASGVLGNVLQGVSSLFWRALSGVAPTTLLCYRIVVSLVTLVIMMLALQRLGEIRARLSRRAIAVHSAAAILVAINWGTFIWASVNGHVIESGLGYLIAPFVAIGVGTLVFKDAMTRARRAALLVIAASIALLLVRSGELSHWVYLVIGATWGSYACLKSVTKLDALTGLLIETSALALALGALSPLTRLGLALPPDPGTATLALLATCGLVSVVPLWLFAHAASRLSLSALGFIQFVMPSTQLVVALVAYRQPMSANTLASFAVIWLALLVIALESVAARARSSARAATR
jgi:chloramphenicol-sensitive protein RarD